MAPPSPALPNLNKPTTAFRTSHNKANTHHHRPPSNPRPLNTYIPIPQSPPPPDSPSIQLSSLAVSPVIDALPAPRKISTKPFFSQPFHRRKSELQTLLPKPSPQQTPNPHHPSTTMSRHRPPHRLNTRETICVALALLVFILLILLFPLTVLFFRATPSLSPRGILCQECSSLCAKVGNDVCGPLGCKFDSNTTGNWSGPAVDDYIKGMQACWLVGDAWTMGTGPGVAKRPMVLPLNVTTVWPFMRQGGRQVTRPRTVPQTLLTR
ncbi:hypothetical protein EJ04DRAFT_525276 [Polyplosphaeria fusca]|uniref:Uncharacterized protein n=1 Tax=Polyplosphaeria fusca TaxID=682080 RepID=A0A9P4QRI9_9PLEO|nr:hypothetical protein EJ04DRAFT_525276 [Polyplosphaeria fusca]